MIQRGSDEQIISFSWPSLPELELCFYYMYFYQVCPLLAWNSSTDRAVLSINQELYKLQCMKNYADFASFPDNINSNVVYFNATINV